ncbi:hypothetical protein VNO77_39026 [Canavalia gladiata]|uniref:Uncharacterized protein n=1 Tax=Canavalia gladiata TaxID=3824 RepID=A0AAN9KDN7_CANGL
MTSQGYNGRKKIGGKNLVFSGWIKNPWWFSMDSNASRSLLGSLLVNTVVIDGNGVQDKAINGGGGFSAC